MKLLFPSVTCFLFMPFFSQAQPGKDSASSIGAHFKISGGRSFWMGSNYRKEWTTPVKAPIINLATEKGGLKPVRRGGGKQTKSLRLEDANGRQYAFRSIQKFITSKTLPGDLQSEAAADLVADGVSASYPYAPLSIPVLARAAGVPYLDVKLVYIPDDPLLGEYREDFANILAWFEERLPDTVKKAWDTEEVADKLKDDNDNEVNQQALLRARILDMFVMDLDRHEDQWQWGAYDKEKGKVYYPIPRDRDQAFYTNQGLIPGIAKWPWLVPQIEGFKPNSNNINRFNFAARNLDRFFLNGLTEQDWMQATDKFLTQMTDQVIEEAINRQPPEIRHFSGDKLISILKERRKYLKNEMMQYYRFLAEYVNITGSDKKELFEITRHEDGSVLLQVFKITKKGEQGYKMYERTFSPGTTKELRLYGFGDQDQFVLKGSSNDKIKIRMIGGEGQDEFESLSSGKKTWVYDNSGKENSLSGNLKDRTSHDTAVNTFDRLGYKYNQAIPFVSFGFNQDDGLFIGPSLKIIRHGFRKTPYKTMQQIAFNYAFSTKAFNARWYSEYISLLGKNTDLLTDIDIKAPNNTTNFFGYGINSVYDKTSPGKFRYYRARYSLGDISVMLRKNFSPKVSLMLGPVYQFFSLDENDKFNTVRFITDIANNGLDPNTLFEKQSYFGGKISIVADTRDNKVLTKRGIVWQSALRYLSGQTNASYKNVTQLNSEFTFHVQLGQAFVFTNRTGGGHNFGDFEFYQAQYLGAEDNLRGYRKFRFAGRSKFYNNAELRIRLAKFQTYLFPGYMGFLVFLDAGRVWADNISANTWVSGYGGGLWFSPMSRMIISFSYAASKEDKLPLVGLGWKF
jgi:hypothetical protein